MGPKSRKTPDTETTGGDFQRQVDSLFDLPTPTEEREEQEAGGDKNVDE